ncbi:OsmC family protein [Neomicrococcus aestuarii]|uniref:Peroxiredoxin n=1 Tax=Neomicrococcus aestuarii TaxID=556325 RepID=A0A1L2ZKU0_9MICC|nr:OsmC family protein [Neomicrococcus aestuarii]APF39993.1 peroxiredoxin [Neomicrococcus aestuarii]
MSLSEHHFELTVEWTGNNGTGTSGYRDYSRIHEITAEGPGSINGSAARPFRGDTDRWNPEQLLLAALTQCHMLSYLHVAVQNGVVVTGYTDTATAQLHVNSDGSGEITHATLRPRVELEDESQRDLADSLHDAARDVCFIARSVNFPVHHEPESPTA